MSRLFISHSSANNIEAVAIRDWLGREGWDEVFLDLDPARGIAAGERWERALNEAASRCEAVLFVISRAWLDSRWCLKEFHLARRLNKRLFGVLVEAIPLADLPEDLSGTWQVVDLAAGQDHEMLRVALPRSQEEAHVTFSREGLARLRGGLARAGLEPRFFDWPPKDDPERSPYRGLRPLEAEDAGIFFGRDAPIVGALDALRGLREAAAPRLLVILGASGSGKSSFLRAGLLPRLARDDRNFLPLPPIRPEHAALTGEAGLLPALEAALAAYGLTQRRADIRKAIAGGAEPMRELLQQIADKAFARTLAEEGAAPHPTIVIAIDQAEELFTADGLAEGEALLALLRDLALEDRPGIIVLFTIRSDSYDRLETARPFEGLRQQTLPLLPMPRGAYQTVIEGPAARLAATDRRLRIEPQLTQRLLEDIEKGGGSDALPLLAFTLEQLYRDYGGLGALTAADYEAFGGIGGAIEAAVERVLKAADSNPRIPREREARLLLLRRGLIPWLAGIDPETGSPRRRIARLADVPSEAAPLIGLLVEQRLLSTDAVTTSDGARETTIEPAHEALLRQWGLLQGWLEEDLGALTTLEAVKRATRDWAANNRAPDWLNHAGGRLEDAEQVAARPDFVADLSGDARDYLCHCREAEAARRREREAAQTRAQKLQRRVLSAVTAGLAVALVLAGLAGWQWHEAALAAAAAQTAQSEANRQKTVAETRLADVQLNQSRFLTARAEDELRAGGDPVRAELIARAALPDNMESPDRPVWNPALAVLAQLRGRYRQHMVPPNYANVLVLEGHTDVVSTARFSPDGKIVATASLDDTARLWDTRDGAPYAVLQHPGAVPSRTDQMMIFLQRFMGERFTRLSANFSPDGKQVVTTFGDSTARVWDTTHGDPFVVLQPSPPGDLSNASFSPDNRLVLTASQDGRVSIWDSAGGALLVKGNFGMELSNPTGSGSVAPAFSPDSRSVASLLGFKSVQLWDARTGARLHALEGHTEEIDSIAFSPDGARIVTTSADRTARVWDARTGAPLAVLIGHQGRVTSAVFSPDGQRVVTGSEDTTAWVWDARTGAQISVLEGHAGAVFGVTFSPDGRRVATASADKTARLWDVETGAETDELSGHTGPVRSVMFSADGRRLVTASDDKTARIWPVWPLLTADNVTYAELTAPRELTPQERTILFLPQIEPVAAAPQAAIPDTPGAKCDNLASDPYDPGRRGAGIDLLQIKFTAIQICRDALEANPGDARYEYLLGRALDSERLNSKNPKRQWDRYIKDLRTAAEAAAYAARLGAQAAQTYRAAAGQGYAPAVAGLAALDEAGIGVPQDYSAALQLYRKAADGGYKPAFSAIGRLYGQGEGVTKDDKEALSWFDRGAQSGDPFSQRWLADLYETGVGVPQDLPQTLLHRIIELRLFQQAGDVEEIAKAWSERVAAALATDPEAAIRVAHEADAWQPKEP